MPKKNDKSKKGMSLQDLLVAKLKMLYDVENQLVKTLPKMVKKSSYNDLKKGFERNLKQTLGHVKRLEQVFDLLEVRPQKLQSDAIRALLADAEWVMKNIKGDALLDAGLIGAAQSVEHFEIAGYFSAIGWAKVLDKNEVVDLLQDTLDEEQETSDELAELAHSDVDEAAAGNDGTGGIEHEADENNESDDENNDEDEEEETEEDGKTL